MSFLHRDGTVVSFNIGSVSNAISKALLRQRERELKMQKGTHTLVLTSMSEALFYRCFEENFYQRIVEQKTEQNQLDEELQFIKQIKDYKNKDDGIRIKNMLLAQLRGASRSIAMRHATDLNLVTMPTHPTKETAFGSLNCGRITHVVV